MYRYHVSDIQGLETLEPRLSDEAALDDPRPRISISPDLAGCLAAVPARIWAGESISVYVLDIDRPDVTAEQVSEICPATGSWDSGEEWMLRPVAPVLEVRLSAELNEMEIRRLVADAIYDNL